VLLKYGGTSSCQQEVVRQQSSGFSLHKAELRAMMQFAPVLNLPGTATVIQRLVVGNSSLSRDMYESSAVFASEESGAGRFAIRMRVEKSLLER
jgi:hypothetical protein